MKIQRVTFNTKSSRMAEEIRHQLILCGVRLLLHYGPPEISSDTLVSRTLHNTLQGIVVNVPVGMIPAAREVLYDIFCSNRYGIHSMTVAGTTRLTEHVTFEWLSDSLGKPGVRSAPLARERGA